MKKEIGANVPLKHTPKEFLTNLNMSGKVTQVRITFFL